MLKSLSLSFILSFTIVAFAQPGNDTPCNATTLTVQATANCTYTNGTTVNATQGMATNPSCDGNTLSDVWYKFVIPASGSVNIWTANDGSESNGSVKKALYKYDGTGAPICSNLSEVDCTTSSWAQNNYSGMNYSDSPGTEVYLRVWTLSGSFFDRSFDICVKANDLCGFPDYGSNDFCKNAGQIVPGAGLSNDLSNYTRDTDDPDANNPIDLYLPAWGSNSIENNVWYYFDATASAMTFSFSGVSCTFSWERIQATVFEVGYDANGCCSSFTSLVSGGGWIQPSAGSTGSFQATGMTPGNQYVLMVDGNAGAQCEFTLNGWEETGVLLPVELLSFEVAKETRKNHITWATSSEINNDYFIVERSEDAQNFTSIGVVDGAGDSQSEISYEFYDEDYNHKTLYYRLRQVDFDGVESFSNIRAVVRNASNVHLQVNGDELSVLFSKAKSTSATMKIIGTDGKVIEETFLIAGDKYVSQNFSNLSSGIYFVQITDVLGNELLREKVIK